MLQTILSRMAVLAIVGLLAATMLSACGGGSGAPQSGASCAIGTTAGCGGSGSVTQPPPPQPDTPASTPPPQPDTSASMPAPAPIDPATLPAALSLVFSAPELSTAANGNVTLTAIVKNASNAALAAVPVSFAADSGLLSLSLANTDSQGRARVTLSSGADPANRNINVTAKAGSLSASATLASTGTTVSLNGPASLSTGSVADLALRLSDAAGQPIAYAPVSFSSRLGNSLSVKADAAARTDAQGQLTLRLQASHPGVETVSASALGASTSKSISIAGGELLLAPAPDSAAEGTQAAVEVAVNTCQPVDVTDTRSAASRAASIVLTSTLGQLYRDRGCLQSLTAPLKPSQGGTSNGGWPRSFVRSSTSGVTTITAMASNGPSTQTRLEFVAALTAAAQLSLQASPATLAANPVNPVNQTAAYSVLSAMVRDGTPANNPVKHAMVLFALTADPSGGALQAPASAITGSDGLATAIYVAGRGDSGRDGAQVQARAVDPATGAVRASASSKLTVSQQALSIQLGTGNRLTELSTSMLQQEFTVLLSDSAGKPVPGASISAAVWATRYRKGTYQWKAAAPPAQPAGRWMLDISATCLNEDRQRNGIYHAADDINHDGVLQPGLPVTVSGAAPTDALGLSTLTLNFPRDHGNWLEVELTVRGSVSGTESSAKLTSWLGALSSDLGEQYLAPPGAISPYGRADCGSSD